jgi:hypothetical protein
VFFLVGMVVSAGLQLADAGFQAIGVFPQCFHILAETLVLPWRDQYVALFRQKIA